MKQLIKKMAYRIVPLTVLNFIKIQREKIQLKKVGKLACNTDALLRSTNPRWPTDVFLSPHLGRDWAEAAQELGPLMITEQAWGVNPGDRRAIFYLVRHLRSRTILEIGTHIGASMIHMISALQKDRSKSGDKAHRLTTVDIVDVNDTRSGPWLKYGSAHSPKDMVAKLGAAHCVTFIKSTSLDYFVNCGEERFDFIFLDGDHSAQIVYQEICAALRVLSPGGVILLHDYFPGLRPLWSNGILCPGPWLAVQRLLAEGVKIKVWPLGALPWATKLDSSITSLAILIGE